MPKIIHSGYKIEDIIEGYICGYCYCSFEKDYLERKAINTYSNNNDSYPCPNCGRICKRSYTNHKGE